MTDPIIRTEEEKRQILGDEWYETYKNMDPRLKRVYESMTTEQLEARIIKLLNSIEDEFEELNIKFKKL